MFRGEVTPIRSTSLTAEDLQIPSQPAVSSPELGLAMQCPILSFRGLYEKNPLESPGDVASDPFHWTQGKREWSARRARESGREPEGTAAPDLLVNSLCFHCSSSLRGLPGGIQYLRNDDIHLQRPRSFRFRPVQRHGPQIRDRIVLRLCQRLGSDLLCLGVFGVAHFDLIASPHKHGSRLPVDLHVAPAKRPIPRSLQNRLCLWICQDNGRFVFYLGINLRLV